MLLTIATIAGIGGLKTGLVWKLLALLSTLAVGVLTFPPDPTTQAGVSRGSGFLFFGPATTNGVDTTLTASFGPTTGGIELDDKRTLVDITTDQYLGPIGTFPGGEAWEVKATFLHDHLQQHYYAWTTLGTEATPANVLTNGTLVSPAGQLTIGESSGRRYMQLVWKGPGPGESVTRTIQFWRATPMPGNWKFEKAKPRSMPVTFKVMTDPGAGQNSRGYVGIVIDA